MSQPPARGLQLIFIFGVVLCLLACDPGVDYTPTQLEEIRPEEWLIFEGDGIEITTLNYIGFLNSESFVAEFRVENPTDRTVRLIDATLYTEEAEFKQDVSSVNEGWRTVNPRSSGALALFFFFDEPFADVLGDRPRLVMELEIGNAVERVDITYRRGE